MIEFEDEKFIELFVDITTNGTIIPYDSSMEATVEKHLRKHSLYLDAWHYYIGRKRRELGEDFIDWLRNIHTIDDVPDLERIGGTVPNKNIEIAWNNMGAFMNKIKTAIDNSLAEASLYCQPKTPNSTVVLSCYIGDECILVSYSSFDKNDSKKYKSKLDTIFNNMVKEMNIAVNAFNEAQGKGKPGNKNIVCKEIKNSTSATAKKSEKENSGHGHVVSNLTTFEGSIHLDYMDFYREGKGGHIENGEIAEFFNYLPKMDLTIGSYEKELVPV